MTVLLSPSPLPATSLPTKDTLARALPLPARDYDGWATIRATYLDGVLVQDGYVFVFLITKVHSRTNRVQNVMERFEVSYSIMAFSTENGTIVGSKHVRARRNAERRYGREWEVVLKTPAGPLLPIAGGVSCFGRDFVVKSGKLLERSTER